MVAETRIRQGEIAHLVTYRLQHGQEFGFGPWLVMFLSAARLDLGKGIPWIMAFESFIVDT
jgi:hypothetical protein